MTVPRWLWFLALIPAVAWGARVDRFAVGNTSDAELRQVLDDHWRWLQQVDPVKALRAGDSAALTRFENRSPDTRARVRREAGQLLGWLQQQDPSGLSVADLETWTLLERSLQARLDQPLCALDRWLVTTWRNPFAEATRSALDRDLSGPMAIRLVARVERLPTEVEHEVRSLRLGMASGRVADRGTLERLIADLERLQATPAAAWDLAAPARLPHPAWRAPVVGAFATELTAAVRDHGVPALDTYLAFLREELLPETRVEGGPGLSGLSGGEACYTERILWFTTLPLEAEELHELGLSELERIHGELARLGAGLWGTGSADEVLLRLRTDPALRYESADELEDVAQDALRESWSALRRGFARRPRVGVVVEPMSAAWGGVTWAAQYQKPSAGGELPGRYVLNTSRPETRARYEGRALAFHEAVPGHHLQATLGVLDRDLPAFRRGWGPTVLVEGWGVYAEGLADELGLYPTELDRMGRYTMEAWRAARLVVDTGLHGRGWSREQAVDFLLAETALSRPEAESEVERYLAWPGQALAYQVGARELWGLRAGAEEALGEAFDLKAFHQVVLEGGGITVEQLRARVGAWVAAGG